MSHLVSQSKPSPGPFVWLVLIFLGGTIGYGGWIVKLLTAPDDPTFTANTYTPPTQIAFDPDQTEGSVYGPYQAEPIGSPLAAESSAFYTDPMQPEQPIQPYPSTVEDGGPIVLRPSRQEPTLAPVPVAVDEGAYSREAPRHMPTQATSQVRTVSIDVADELREAVRSIVGDQPVEITLTDGVCRIRGEVSNAADARAVRGVVQRHPAVRVFQDELRVAGAR